ncbi:hypothetical protein G9A89_020295 [Geosiphon pyriformis]|nr:hypothetical protein G9A89_020295 [Geosiphon pyriformis]
MSAIWFFEECWLMVSDAATYFLVLNMSIGIGVHGFVSFTMAELQAIALSLDGHA